MCDDLLLKTENLVDEYIACRNHKKSLRIRRDDFPGMIFVSVTIYSQYQMKFKIFTKHVPNIRQQVLNNKK